MYKYKPTEIFILIIMNALNLIDAPQLYFRLCNHLQMCTDSLIIMINSSFAKRVHIH